jgi:hypothetical protein
MEIPKNGMFGGAPAFSYQSADGWIYYCFVGDGDNGFGTYVWKYKNGVNQNVGIEYFSPARGSMSLEANGLWLTLYRRDEKALVRIPVPGFIVPGYPSNGETGETLPPTTGSGVDNDARARIAALEQKYEGLKIVVDREVNNLWNAIIADRKVVKALQTAITEGQKMTLTKEQVEAIAWQKGLDAQFWSLTTDSDARKALVTLIKENAGADVSEAEIEAAVKKALAAALTKVLEELTT